MRNSGRMRDEGPRGLKCVSVRSGVCFQRTPTPTSLGQGSVRHMNTVIPDVALIDNSDERAPLVLVLDWLAEVFSL